MKKSIGILYWFFVLLSSGAWNSSIAQPYIPMLGETNEWRVVSCFSGCVTSAYYTSGDTVVDGNLYQVLDGYHYINGNMLIREDVQERKVYLKQTYGHSLLPEFTLYDFSLEIGDTVDVYNPISPLPEDGGKFVLDSIVQKALETDDHRYFYLHAVNPSVSNSTNTVWVEGIGALSLINSPGAMPTEAEHMVCAIQNGDLIYADLDSVFSCGPLNAEVLDGKPKLDLSFYPNPADEKLYIAMTGEQKPFQIQLFNAKGQMVVSEGWVEELSVQNLDKGLYFLSVLFEDGTRLNKRVLISR